MSRRSQMEILIDILKAIAEGKQRPTHIMYKANLSWTRLKKQLNFLIRQGLVVAVEAESGKIYKITKRGLDIVHYFGKIKGELQYYRKESLANQIYIRE